MRDVLKAQDDGLRSLVRFLNSHVGPRRWVLALTADHGMMPYPKDSGGWAIAGSELKKDVNEEFDTNDNETELVDRVLAHGAHVNVAELNANGTSLVEMAEWLTDYRVEDNAGARAIPRYLQGRQQELLFDALVIRGRKTISKC